MKFAIKASTKLDNPSKDDVGVGHDDDQHESFLMGEDLTVLTKISELEDGQPEGSVESLASPVNPTSGPVCPNNENMPPPCISRVIDSDGKAHINIVLGYPERTKWLANVTALIDSASENDVIDITICSVDDRDNGYNLRSILSAVDRCRAHVITHAGALTTMGDVALWLSGDDVRWSKHMSAIWMRQQVAGHYGDISDLLSKGDDALSGFKEYSEYISKRGLFTQNELKTMLESRGMLALFRSELEARVKSLKEVED